MNELAKKPTPDAIREAFSGAESAIETAMGSVLLLGWITDRYASQNQVTPFQSAGMRRDYGDAAKGLGDALAAVVEMHKKAAPLDPEPSPRSGDGK